MIRTTCLAALLALSACGTDDRGPELDPPTSIDGKEDSFQKPTEHGALAFGVVATSTLKSGAAFHAWTFDLSGAAKVQVATRWVAGSPTVDTVLYLYKKNAAGSWGSYIARNDDAPGQTRLSLIDKSLTAGSYRVIVKGYGARDTGPFGVRATCSGAGCQAPAPSCLFGGTFYEIQGTNGLNIVSHQKFTTPAGLSAVHGRQIIKALHASSHTDVTTVAEAFAAADQHELNKLEIYDQAGARAFTAWEYGAGDNSYGAIFVQGTDVEVAKNHDTDIIDCTVQAQTCLFGSTFSDARMLTVSAKVITQSTSLTALEQQQLVAAVREANDSVTTVAQAFASVDQGEVNVVSLRHTGSGRSYTAFEFGAGDNSYGAIFDAGAATMAAAIHDGDLYRCAAF
jgi:hypothetical protein